MVGIVSVKTGCALLGACVLVAYVRAEDTEEESEPHPDYPRYETIVTRMPFGETPPGFDATLPPGSAAAAAAAAQAAAGGVMTEEQRTEQQQKMAASVRVSIINVSPAGRAMVGFTDSTANPPEHYYLPSGGERNGWKVLSVDPAAESATLSKDGVDVMLKLGEGGAGDGKGKKGGRVTGFASGRGMTRQSGTGIAGGRMQNGPGVPRAAPGSPGGGALLNLRARRERQAREEESRRQAAAEAEAKRKEEQAIKDEQAKIEREQAEAARAEQRAQLQQIQEELRRAREERKKSESEKSGDAEPSNEE